MAISYGMLVGQPPIELLKQPASFIREFLGASVKVLERKRAQNARPTKN